MKKYLTQYLAKYPQTIVYMLQSVEYDVEAYFKWRRRVSNFNWVMYRRTLNRTKTASMLLASVWIGMFLQIVASIFLIQLGNSSQSGWVQLFGYIGLVSYPMIWGYLVTVPLTMGRIFMVNPKNKRAVDASEEIFARHPGVKIAVAGSYGKTTMKELLCTVLSEGLNVAVTPANKNVAISHARFAQTLKGDEDVLIIEYGEGRPGDVGSFAQVTHPTIGVITGLAPAHLDHYPSLQSAGEDIFSLADFIDANDLYVNSESLAAAPFIKHGQHTYNKHLVLGWQISDVSVGFDGVKFTMTKDKSKLKLHSGLLGRHQVGPLALVAALSLKLGLTMKEVKAGVGKTVPLEHRMQPRNLNGAWIIDDSYNGNIDGMIAGLRLLSDLPARNRIFVTPGLVDQGVETKAVHIRLGEEIARVKPDQVVLMENSVTPYIKHGLSLGGYEGDLKIETDPLHYYLNVEHYIASGDVVILQNDWTDNYN